MGCPRGGTTWIWSILESHESTKPFLVNIKKEHGTYKTSESGIYVNKPKKAKKELTKFIKLYKDKLIIEKTPQHTLKHKLIRRDFPKSKFVIILRNPVAIVNSMMNSEMNAFKKYDLDKSIIEVKKYYKSLLDIVNQKNTFLLTYENLFENTKFELAQLFDYLKLDKSNIHKIIDENRHTTKVTVQGSFRKAKPDSYLNDLTKQQINQIENELCDEIVKFNKINFENTCYE